MFQVQPKRSFLIGVAIAAVLLTFASRAAVAHYLANDSPGDGIIYSQLARNVLEQHVYSIEDQAPFPPTLIRLPGYPLFVAGVYALFGHGNNGAVRMAQAVLDTASCVLIALIAWNWDPDERRRGASAAIAFALAALCPFMVIYVGTILTETATIFLACAMTLTATYALKSRTGAARAFWWITTGLLGGLCVTFRPDAGLFLGGIGLTLVIVYLFGKRHGTPMPLTRRLTQAVLYGAIMSVAFAAVLTPWAVRNERLFHVFQPLAPAHAEMPGEFVPSGYDKWVRTWIDDGRYIDPALWSLNDRLIKIDDFPSKAFDSPEEEARVAALLDRYNHPVNAQTTPEADKADSQKDEQETSSDNSSDSAGQDNSADSSENQSDNEEADNSGDEADDSEDQDGEEPVAPVAMTPEIDAGFDQIANERIARSRFRYHIWLPLKRAASLWFDTHSQYYPFTGELFPLSDMDHTTNQHIWLPLFTFLTWVYTFLGIAGAYFLWRVKSARKWILLAALMTLPRLAFFSTLENPEPRYVVELFAFLAILGGIGITRLMSSLGALPSEESHGAES